MSDDDEGDNVYDTWIAGDFLYERPTDSDWVFFRALRPFTVNGIVYDPHASDHNERAMIEALDWQDDSAGARMACHLPPTEAELDHYVAYGEYPRWVELEAWSTSPEKVQVQI